MDKIDLQTRLIQNNEKFILSELGDEIIMMNLESGSYIGLNEIGASIWRVLEEVSTIEQVVQKLLDEYDVSVEQCTKEVLEFAIELQGQDVILAVA